MLIIDKCFLCYGFGPPPVWSGQKDNFRCALKDTAPSHKAFQLFQFGHTGESEGHLQIICNRFLIPNTFFGR